MYAVIRIGSHQYEVSPGQTVEVEKLNGPVGSEVRINDVLLVADGDKLETGAEVKGTVVGTIRAQIRGPKMISFKHKRRKGFHKSIGHRQPYTQLEITKIEA